MDYTNLLQRQIKRYFPPTSDISPELHEFLDAINRSYGHYERDHLLGKRSLEISSAELHQLMENLTEQEAHLRAILQSALDGIVVFDEKKDIILCNPVAAKNLGFADENEILGKNAASIKILVLDQIVKESTLYEMSEQDKKYFPEISIPQSNYIFEISLSKFEQANKAYKICILRDITQRKLSEKKIEVRHEITRLLNFSRSIDVVAPKILSIICKELDWDLGFLWLRDLKNQHLNPLFVHDPLKTIASTKFVQESFSTIVKNEDNLYAELLKMEPQLFCDTTYSRMKKASEYQYKGCYIIPFAFEEEVVGFIELFTQKKINEDLEIKKTFSDIGSEIALYIIQRYTVERVTLLQGELLSAARQLGMSQVANSTLHNVGNALNTLTVSANLLQESQDASELNNLSKIASLINEHKEDFPTFILEDPKGKLLPEYFVALSDWWQKDQKRVQDQLQQLFATIQHIQKIIKTQQAIDKYGGIKEVISLNLFLEDMLGLLYKDLKYFGIKIEKNYQELPDVKIDRSALVQILENLLLNAIDALRIKKGERKLTVCTRIEKPNTIQIEITDNGIGIAPDHLEKIFSYGFTLKEAGHGYGLHNSLKLANEFGGQLDVKSEGLEKGASFFLSIPY